MTNLERLYLGLPRIAQNAALDLKGLLEKRTRLGGHYESQRAVAAELRNSSQISVASFVATRLQRIAKIAAQDTDFYPEFWKGITEPTVEVVENLQAFPILTKEHARQNNEKLRRHSLKKAIKTRTTGTTGKPLTVFSSPSGRQHNYAYFDDFLVASGIDPKSKRAILGGRMIVAPDAKPPFWRVCRSTRTLYLSSYHISLRNIHDYAEALKEFQPAFIEAYPSAIASLAKLILETNPSLRFRIPVITSAETLGGGQEKLINQVFQGGVFDQYGAAEMTVFAERCSRGKYHVRSEYGHVEVLNDRDQPTEPGEVGRVVCTGLINDGMPLVRYEIGDLVELATSPCKCGWDTPLWERIIGRIDDVIRTPSGKEIGRLSPVLKGFPILESQIVQEQLDTIIVFVVPSQTFSAVTAKRIRNAFHERLGHEMHVDVRPVEGIPVARGGKRPAVVSKLS